MNGAALGPVAAALAALALLNSLASRAFEPPHPPPTELRLGYDDAVRNVGLMSLGMRRLAADLDFVRLLMYYGAAEDGGEAAHEEHEGREHGSGGTYPELAPRAIRILDLDPWFSYAAQYAAAALAFNLDKTDDALAVLRHASARDPKNWQYRSTVAAIGFRRDGDLAKVRSELLPVVRDPDCPTMLKHIVAYLERRLGHREEAIHLYREILGSRDKGYHGMAERALMELGAAP